MGITHPSIKGQERVVRMAYEKADLDPNLTAYAELHGTGTPVGDPIEVNAISRAMNDTRPLDKPLLIGAVSVFPSSLYPCERAFLTRGENRLSRALVIARRQVGYLPS